MKWILACVVAGMVAGAGPASQPATRPAKPVNLKEVVARIPRELNPERNRLTAIQQQELKEWFDAQAGTAVEDIFVLIREPYINEKGIGADGTWSRGAIFCEFPPEDKKLFEKLRRGDKVRFRGQISSLKWSQDWRNGTVFYAVQFETAKAILLPK